MNKKYKQLLLKILYKIYDNNYLKYKKYKIDKIIYNYYKSNLTLNKLNINTIQMIIDKIISKKNHKLKLSEIIFLKYIHKNVNSIKGDYLNKKFFKIILNLYCYNIGII